MSVSRSLEDDPQFARRDLSSDWIAVRCRETHSAAGQ